MYWPAVITGSKFDEADLTDATFNDALIGFEDVKRLWVPSLYVLC